MSKEHKHTVSNLRACISAMQADEERGCSREHLDTLMAGLADAGNACAGMADPAAEIKALRDCAAAVPAHLAKQKELAKWLQRWLHESDTGKALPEVDRSSIGQVLAESFQATSGSKLAHCARALVKLEGGK